MVKPIAASAANCCSAVFWLAASSPKALRYRQPRFTRRHRRSLHTPPAIPAHASASPSSPATVVGAAVVGMACAHAAMVTVMIMTPLHMEHGGAHLEVRGVGHRSSPGCEIGRAHV